MDESSSLSDEGNLEVSHEKHLPQVVKSGSVYMTICTSEQSDAALGKFDLKYFPIRKTIKQRIINSQNSDSSIKNNVPGSSSSAEGKKNVYEVIENYYGHENIRSIIKENLINKQYYESLQSFADLK